MFCSHFKSFGWEVNGVVGFFPFSAVAGNNCLLFALDRYGRCCAILLM